MDSDEPRWLAIAREMRAMAQTGLTFSQDTFDRQRYQRLQELAAELMAQSSAQEARRLTALFQHDSGYGTPKVDVRGAVFRDGRVLMVREVTDGRWTLPGGWADVNQTPAQCVAREITEESGFIARVHKLAAIYDYRHSNRPLAVDSIYKLFFICEITGGAARISEETSAVGFFARGALPPLSIGRSSEAQIVRMFEHHEQPTRATDFE